MPRETFIATVQIIIRPGQGVESEAQACDWFSGLLSENDKILDWSYLKLGGQYLYPTNLLVSDDYQEGDAF